LKNKLFVVADGMGGHAAGEIASITCTGCVGSAAFGGP
jgi:serine/threonine protein phosphatase PrpC